MQLAEAATRAEELARSAGSERELAELRQYVLNQRNS